MTKDYLISANFSLKEFIHSEEAGIDVLITPIQLLLLKKLVYNIMQPIRFWYGKPIYISSGVRNKAIMNTLRKKGYAVSSRTDHSYSDPEVNQFGTGACDFCVNNNKDLVGIYTWVKGHIDRELIGQMIIYIKTKNQMGNFIHISNSIMEYGIAIKEYQYKKMFLMKRNGHYLEPNFTILKKEIK